MGEGRGGERNEVVSWRVCRTCGGCHGLKTALPPSLSRSSRRSISAREPRAKIIGGGGGGGEGSSEDDNLSTRNRCRGSIRGEKR